MIYLDNAATSLHKPQQVIDAVVDAMGRMGNAGRGATEGSLDASRAIHGCREKLARLFGCAADHVCFAPNSTAALNCAISGVVDAGDRVVTTVMEHNSVLRPLRRLAAERGVDVAYAGVDSRGSLDYDDLAKKLADGADAVVVTHASNVTGNVNDLARISALAHAVGALLVVDASQTAGTRAIDMHDMGIDVLCFTGHKGLMGPQGTGGLAVADGVDVRPWNVGGTGVHSFDEFQPLEWPTRLEAGTQNAHGIAGLSAALSFIEGEGGPKAIGEREEALARLFYEGVLDVDGVTFYGDLEQPGRAAIVALNIDGMGSAEVSDALAQGWGIATRPGAHCAPLMHEALGTREQGVVRFSFGFFNTVDEVATAVSAVRDLAS